MKRVWRGLHDRLEMSEVRLNMLIGAGNLCVETPEIARQEVLVMHCHFYHLQVAFHAHFSQTFVQHNSIIGENIKLGSVNKRFRRILDQI